MLSWIGLLINMSNHGDNDMQVLTWVDLSRAIVAASLCCHLLYRANKGTAPSTHCMSPDLGPRGVTE